MPLHENHNTNSNDNKNTVSTKRKDPNVLTSPAYSFVWRHWYAGVKTVALYIIFILITSPFDTPIWLQWVVSFVLFGFWVVFDYKDIYQRAMRDSNVVKYGDLEYDPFRGLKTGLIAQIPGFLIVLLMSLISIGSEETAAYFQMLWLILYSPFTMMVSSVQNTIGSGNILIRAVAYLVPLIFQPFIGYLAYKNGYNNIGILNKLIYRSRDKDKRLR